MAEGDNQDLDQGTAPGATRPSAYAALLPKQQVEETINLERFSSLQRFAKPSIEQLCSSMQMLKANLQTARPTSSAFRASSTPSSSVPFVSRPITAPVRCSASAASAWVFSASSPALKAAAPRFHRRFISRPAPRTVTTVRASWGAEVTFSPAKVISSTPVASGMTELIVDVGDLASGYTKPGQFVQIKVGDSKPGFFAIASAPDANNMGVLELLIKSQPGSTAELLCNLPSGSEVMASPVMGKGFPVDKIPAADFPTVLLFATGSGISPVKALIESGVLEADKRKDVRLYYGTRNPESTAYLERITDWMSTGVKVRSVFSDDGKGYVQEIFKSEMEISDPGRVGVILCGQKGMCEAVKAMVAEAGVDAGNVLLNF